jgi:hypothetical protein
VLRHQLGQNLVLGLDLLLHVGDPFLFGGMVRPYFLLEGSGTVLEEFLLPAVEDRVLQAEFIAQLRDGLPSPVNAASGDLFSRRVVPPLLLHYVLSLRSWENASSISS